MIAKTFRQRVAVGQGGEICGFLPGGYANAMARVDFVAAQLGLRERGFDRGQLVRGDRIAAEQEVPRSVD